MNLVDCIDLLTKREEAINAGLKEDCEEIHISHSIGINREKPLIEYAGVIMRYNISKNNGKESKYCFEDGNSEEFRQTAVEIEQKSEGRIKVQLDRKYIKIKLELPLNEIEDEVSLMNVRRGKPQIEEHHYFSADFFRCDK